MFVSYSYCTELNIQGMMASSVAKTPSDIQMTAMYFEVSLVQMMSKIVTNEMDDSDDSSR